MAASTQSVHVRVLAASTGVCYNISLHPSELTVANLRRHLAGAVPPEDQILLLGPPYKVPKDSTLRSAETLSSLRLGDQEDDPSFYKTGDSDKKDEKGQKKNILGTTERSGARRLFLFSKQALSESAPDPPPCHLEPMTLNLPTEPDPSPVIFDRSTSGSADSPSSTLSPLHQALEVYERRFMLHLCRGRALADGADMRLSACRNCVSEQAVMARALRAAVSNLSDHRNGAARTRTEFTANFQAKTATHATLLQRFESHMSSLAAIRLHPALVSVARASGRMMETLLDTVPVERERAWANQCNTSHQRLLTLFSELDNAFAQLGTQASREEEARQDLEAEDEVKVLSTEVEGTATEIRNRQAQRLDKLTNDHVEVVKVVVGAISNASGEGAQAAFTTLEEMSTASADTLPSMESDDLVLMETMKRVADAKTRAMKRMRHRLRQVSIAQSAIQRVLSNVAVLRDALLQQCDNMVHLEHVAELPASYRDFLSEIRRRRAYGGAVTSSSAAMMEKLALMRADEVKSREKFLRGSGRHLMPAFFEIFAPTLATPPPLFTPQLPAMVEMDTLPDVGTADSAGAHANEGGSSSLGSTAHDTQMQGNVSTDVHGASGASSLTDSQPQHHHEKNPCEPSTVTMSGVGTGTADVAASRESVDKGNTPAKAIDERENRADRQSLIVSADENSGADIIMEPTSHGDDEAAAEAERKTLAYENAVLRQAMERMGGKSPRTYIDEAREKDKLGKLDEHGEQRGEEDKSVSALISELSTLRSELEEAKAQVATAEKARLEAKKGSKKVKGCDKISHSSFEVGDVGLFMPTGRGTGGKRTYLAFHSNCPHRYLSTDSIKGTPDYVLGRIVYQEELVAGATGADSNPYGLHVGTKFWVLTVEVLTTP